MDTLQRPTQLFGLNRRSSRCDPNLPQSQLRGGRRNTHDPPPGRLQGRRELPAARHHQSRRPTSSTRHDLAQHCRDLFIRDRVGGRLGVRHTRKEAREQNTNKPLNAPLS